MKTRAPRGWTYASAGVDIRGVKKAHESIAGLLEATHAFRRGSVIRGSGHYAGLVDIGSGRALALHVDGVGTKVLVAQALRKFDTIGIDCVAMNVNDIICLGAVPLAFLDYIALREADEDLIHEIVKGLVKGAEEASVAIVGGETAIVPELLSDASDKAFDLVGMVAGIVRKGRVITGQGLRKGDIILGIESSGIHSNGLTLARKVLLQKHSFEEELPGLKGRLGDELLEPTRIYVKPITEVLRKGVEVSGLAHVTGGAFTKFERLVQGARLGFQIDGLPEPPPIFRLIQDQGKITQEEMYRTFNMGVGFCVIAPERSCGRARRIIASHGMRVHEVGRVVGRRGVYVSGSRL